jgi:hypothetical protein
MDGIDKIVIGVVSGMAVLYISATGAICRRDKKPFPTSVFSDVLRMVCMALLLVGLHHSPVRGDRSALVWVSLIGWAGSLAWGWRISSRKAHKPAA